MSSYHVVSPQLPLYHLLRGVTGRTVDTLVHVGAHIGQELVLYEAVGCRRVVWVEGDPAIIPRLMETIRNGSNGKTEHVVVHAMITDRDGDTVALRRFSNNGASSSIFGATPMMAEVFGAGTVAETGEVVEAPSRTLESVLRELDIPPDEVDALVIDIQGAELLCLRGMGPYLEAASFMEVEVSRVQIYDGAPLFEEVDAYLRGHGWHLLTPFELEHGDVVYINPKNIQFAAPPG